MGVFDLFPVLPLERVRQLSAIEPVPVQNSSDCHYVIDSDGRKWVRKVVTASDLLSECVSFMLCRLLDVSVPGAAYLQQRDGDEPMWLSAVVDSVVHWNHRRAQILHDPSELGGILAIDALVGNFDRNHKNILLTPNPDVTCMRVYGIDFANSWVGSPRGFAELGLGVPDVTNHVRGVPVEAVSSGAQKVALKLNKIHENELSAIVANSCSVACEPQSDILLSALRDRCAHAEQIVGRHLESVAKL